MHENILRDPTAALFMGLFLDFIVLGNAYVNFDRKVNLVNI